MRYIGRASRSPAPKNPSDRPLVTNNRLRTPRAAAVAGILFAVLLGTAIFLVRMAVPEVPTSDTGWLLNGAGKVRIAVGIIPFAGIAFLWFMGVVRDRFGPLEDRFFSTLFLGSGLLFLGMLFVWAALAGGLLAAVSADVPVPSESSIYLYGQEVMFGISRVFVIRMASVFMLSLGTIWLRTGTMPRWLAILTYGLALILLVSPNLNLWATLAFPLWVLVISVRILASDLREGNESALDLSVPTQE
jgi:hypothetical protein